MPQAHIVGAMFNFFHPQPVVSRRAVPVLVVQQTARQQVLSETVLINAAPGAAPAPTDPATSAPLPLPPLTP